MLNELFFNYELISNKYVMNIDKSNLVIQIYKLFNITSRMKDEKLYLTLRIVDDYLNLKAHA